MLGGAFKDAQRLMRIMRIAALGPKLKMTLARPGDRPTEPGLGCGHYPHPDWLRLPLPRGYHRMGEPGGADLAPVEYHGRRVLHRRPRRWGAWQARDLQRRSGQPVHRRHLRRLRCCSCVAFIGQQRGRRDAALGGCCRSPTYLLRDRRGRNWHDPGLHRSSGSWNSPGPKPLKKSRNGARSSSTRGGRSVARSAMAWRK